MKCPQCGKSISKKHWDDEYEWYECPKCEGCFTQEEMDDLKPTPRKSKAPKAKGKARAETLDAEAEALAEYEKKQLEPTVKQVEATHHRDEIRTKEVVNIMADEIQEIYHALGFSLDETNAQDKALILWRDAKLYAHAGAREHEVEHVLCKAHSG
jgi:hypothetical protein